jgi:hypothetical protein
MASDLDRSFVISDQWRDAEAARTAKPLVADQSRGLARSIVISLPDLNAVVERFYTCVMPAR